MCSECVCFCSASWGTYRQSCVHSCWEIPTFLWMEGYNLRATQLTRGNGSNSTNMAPSKRRIPYQHGAHGHTSKSIKNGQLSWSHFLTDTQPESHKHVQINHTPRHVNTCAPCRGLSRGKKQLKKQLQASVIKRRGENRLDTKEACSEIWTAILMPHIH